MTGHVREARGHRIVGPVGRPCDPDRGERHYVVAAALIATALIGAYSAYSANEAQSEAAEYQSKVAKNQSDAARQAADIAAQNEAEQNRRIRATQRARAAGSGIEEDEGSSLLAQMEAAEQDVLNQRRILHAGRTQARGFQAESILQGFAAKNYERQGYVNAGASIIGGAGKAYGAYSSTGTGKT